VPIQMQCPQCRAKAALPDGHAGRPVRCKRCKASFAVPADAGANPDQPTAIDRYLVRELLGEGSFGSVYRAFDPRLERDVALKVVRPQMMTSAHAVDRFLRKSKGTMSEVELTTMRNRLERGKLHKAERGELILTVPCSYLKLPHGEVILDPDEQVRATVQLVFAKFAELGSFGKVYRYLRQNKILIGCRVHQGPRRGELVWRPVSRALLGRTLHHPIDAGAYSYGRRRVDPKRTAASGGKVRMRYVPMADWKVLQRDRFPAYITWDCYLANQQRL
jgi:Recombinase